MDFHGLPRRDLQTLCKKNRIPANMTNVAMADALQALQSVEGLAEIQEALQFQSPKKLDLASPRKSRRTTASRKEDAAVPEEQQASPLPRARRVTARASGILDLAEDAEEEKEVAETPKVPNTRRRATAKKEEKPAVGVTAGRRARQSTKKEVEGTGMGVDSMMSTGLRRSTRMGGKVAASTLKMASLAKEAVEEKLENEADAEAVVDQKIDLPSEDIEIVAETKEKFDGKDYGQELNMESEAIQESSEIVEEEQGVDQEKSVVDQEKSSDQDSNPVAVFENLETVAADDGGFELQEEPSFSGKCPAEIEDSGEQSASLEIPPSSDDLISNVEITATETMESSEDNGELTDEIEESSGEDEVTVEAVESGDDKGEITAEATEKSVVDQEKSSDQDSNPAAVFENLETEAADDGGFELQEEPSFSGKCPAEIEDSGEQSLSLEIPPTSDDLISNVEITTTETMESSEDNGELTDEIEESSGEDEVTVEAVESGDDKGEITAEATESTEDNCEITEETMRSVDGYGEESTGELSDLTVDIPVEVDESGGDLESCALAGEISVEAVEAPEPAAEIAGESLDEVIGGLSDLHLSSKSAGKVLPVAGDSNKENSSLTALTGMEADPTAGGGGGAAKVKPNYENLSLRKLKAVYKETLVTINNKGKEKREALRVLDENCI